MENKVLAQAYQKCESITKAASSTFYTGSKFFPVWMQKHVWAVYAFCRVADDVVDEGDEAVQKREASLDLMRRVVKQAARRGLRHRISNISPSSNSQGLVDLVNLALVDTFQKFPELTAQPFLDLLDGVSSDLHVGEKNFSPMQTWDELMAYCEKVAGGVGEIICQICSVKNKKTILAARKMGNAMQLTNIVRDFGEDWQSGRVYLPEEVMKKFGILNSNLGDRNLIESTEFQNMMRWLIGEIRVMYRDSRVELNVFPLRVRYALTVASLMYEGVLDDVERHKYDVVSRRAYVTIGRKLWCLLQASALLI